MQINQNPFVFFLLKPIPRRDFGAGSPGRLIPQSFRIFCLSSGGETKFTIVWSGLLTTLTFLFVERGRRRRSRKLTLCIKVVLWWKRAMPRQARLDAPGTLHHVMIREIKGKGVTGTLVQMKL